ncbi:MAG TPA: imelysin family protein [Bauldia sp.]|nr:imelysin family protein [Bauldia sp.]
MKKSTKTWLGVGIFALAGTALSPLAPASAEGGEASLVKSGAAVPPAAPFLLLAAGGEGGEGGGEGGLAPESYALPGSAPFAYDAGAEIAAYAEGVHRSYVAAAAAAKRMQEAIAAFLADPTREKLAAARAAWVAARPAYLVTEAFRFYDGPIEDIEGRLNAWPLNEAFLDYVAGKPDAGIINDPAIPISLLSIDERDQVSDESNVTTGWHAVEFLLWGQDLSATGPGARPASDYAPGEGNNDRRRRYLELVTGQLVSDIARLADSWAPGADNYAKAFRALAPREAIGRILNGMAVLAGSELMSERMAVGLDSGDQEDEHSCFSDTTHQDFVFDVKGIADVWNGTTAGGNGAGIGGLVRRVDPALAGRVDGLVADAVARVAALGDPWDRVLAAPPGSPPREAAEAAVQALGALGQGLKEAGEKLGVLVQIPS